MRIKPDFNLNSIYDINAFLLKSLEISTLFFDLDSTVMKSKSGEFSEKTIEFLNYLQKHFKVAIVSNNNNPEYIAKAQKQVEFKVIGKAKKPDTKALLSLCEEMRVKPINCAFVGDRPLTDIGVAKKAKMMSILVDSISKEEEHKIVRFVRFLEKLTIKK